MTTTSSVATEPGALDERLRTLRRCRIFDLWPPSRLAEAAAIARIQCHARGAQVFAHELRRREVLVIASGRIELSRGTAAGKRYVRTVAGAGEALGWIRLLTRVPLHYEYRAYDDSVLLHLPCDPLIGILDSEPALWRDVALLMCERHGEIARLLNDQALGTLEQRMAATLAEMANAQGFRDRSEKERVEWELRISQESLGAMLGVTRQSVNEVLRSFERLGIVSKAYNRVTIRDIRVLRDFASRRD